MIFDLIKVSQRQKAKEWIDSLIPKIIEIKEYKPKRSNPANRYYWAMINCISHDTGNDKDTLHEYFKQKYLNHEILEINLKKVFHWIEIYSTTKLNSKEFAQYCEKIRIFANTELSITIPSKDDEYFENFLTMYGDLI